jgi:signal transduction histidine kinase
MKTIFSVSVLILYLSFGVYTKKGYSQTAQTTIDSLNLLLQGQSEKEKILTLTNLGTAYLNTDPDKAISLFDQSLVLALKFNDFECAYKNQFSKGRAFFLKADIPKSAECFKKAADMARKAGKPELTTEALVNAGSMIVESGQFEEGLKYYYESLETAKLLPDSTLYYTTFVTIGLAYGYMHDNKKGLTYMKEALDFFRRKKIYKKIAFALGNMAAIEKEQNKYKEAITYLDELLLYARQFQISEYTIFALNGLGECYYAIGQKEKSLNYFTEGLKMAKETHHEWYIQNFLINSASIMNDQKEYLKAESNLQDALKIAEKSKKFDAEKTIYQMLVVSAIGQGNKEKAKQYTTKALTANDSLFSKNTSSKIADLETKYKTKEKEAQLAEQKAQNFRQRTWLIALIISLLALAAFSYLYYNRYRLKQKAILDAAIIKEQQLGLSAVIEAQETERKRIAKDLHDGVAQELVALKLGFNRLQNKIEKIAPEESNNIAALTHQLNDSCNEVRNIAHVMMPPSLETSGLVSALEMLLRNSLQHSNIQLEFEYFDLPEKLNDKTKIGLYRIAQELLNNILKHAQATKVILQIYKAGNQLIMRLEDNGKGFDFETAKQKNNMGLLNILSRVNHLGGTFFSEKADPSGTISTVRIPVVV